MLYITLLQLTPPNSVQQADTLPCYQQWWMDNKMGGYDGFELRANGDLKLLNYDTFLGKKWWIKNNILYTQIVSRNNPTKIITNEYHIKSMSNEIVTTEKYSNGEQYNIVFEKIDHSNFTNDLMGHWDGENESYIQIIPVNSWKYQLVISAGNSSDVIKYYGDLNSDDKTIEYEIKMETVFPVYQKNGNTETIELNGKIYSRTCN